MPRAEGLCFSSLPRHYEGVPSLQEFRARDGEKLSFRSYSSDNREKVFILLHGSSAHGEYLHPLAERLKSIGEVYVPNIRGHYGSGSVRGDCSYIGQLEDDFADLVDYCYLRNREIHVIGHSSGGGLAIRLAGGRYGNWIRKYVLLSPAIPTAPTMRGGDAGGWANVAVWKIVLLTVLNFFCIRFLDHWKVISFNRPEEYCDGTETLSYSFNLNSSLHPRLPYHHDIAALRDKSLVIVGSEDEANDPARYPEVMQDRASIQVIDGVNHLGLVQSPAVSEAISRWVHSAPTSAAQRNP